MLGQIAVVETCRPAGLAPFNARAPDGFDALAAPGDCLAPGNELVAAGGEDDNIDVVVDQIDDGVIGALGRCCHDLLLSGLTGKIASADGSLRRSS